MKGYRQTLKAEILDLSDGGMTPDQVWRKLGCKRKYVHATITANAIDVSKERKAENRLRGQSDSLARAVRASGRHMTPSEFREHRIARGEGARV